MSAECRVQNAELWLIFAKAKIFINIFVRKYFTAKRFHTPKAYFTADNVRYALHFLIPLFTEENSPQHFSYHLGGNYCGGDDKREYQLPCRERYRTQNLTAKIDKGYLYYKNCAHNKHESRIF